MRRRSVKFYVFSLAIHIVFLGAVYEIGCPRAVVHSEPKGVTIQVVTGDIFPSAPTKANLNTVKPVFSVSHTKLAPVAKAGNSENAAAANPEAALVGTVNGAEATVKERYLYELRLLLDARKQYPAIAKSLRQEGAVEVGFVLRPDGKIDEAGIVAPSSHETLNRAALQLVETVGKFKPLPTELQKLIGWHVSVPIEYRLR